MLSERTYGRYFRADDNVVVRVFWVCRSTERIQSLCEKLRSEPVAQFFRFTTITEFTADSALTIPIWQAVDGKRREILRLPAARR